MRDINRIDKLQNIITEYWKLPQHADLRYFQFINYLDMKVKETLGYKDSFYIEDDVLIKVVINLMSKDSGLETQVSKPE